MVILHVKQGETSLFQLEATQQSFVEKILESICFLQNGKLKIYRICNEIEELSQYGPLITTPNKHDSSIDCKYNPERGCCNNIDQSGKRCGKRPCEKMQNILLDTVNRAQKLISSELQKNGVSLTQDHIQECLGILRGAVAIVYPNGLPAKDPILLELLNEENLVGTEEANKIFVPSKMQLWFASKEMKLDKKLAEYFGKNEKSKVIVKVQHKGSGIPIREPFINEDEKKKLMMDEFKRRETLKALDSDMDNAYLDSNWADQSYLKKSFHGLHDVSWKPK